MRRALRVLDLATQGANLLGTALIVVLVAVICADVAGRELLGQPLRGVPEIMTLSIVAIVFLQVPQAFKAGRLTRSDGLLNALAARRPSIAGALETAFEALGILVVSAIVYAHWPILTRAITRGDFVGSVGNVTFPTWPVKLMILVGCVLLILQFAARILRRYARGPA